MCDCGPRDPDGGQYMCPADVDYYEFLSEAVRKAEVIIRAVGVSAEYKVEKIAEEFGISLDDSDPLPF